MGILHPRGDLSCRWYAMAVAAVSLIMATTIGNIAVLVALRRTRTAPAHYPLASLAAADLLVGLFVVPIAAARELFVFHLHPSSYWTLCSLWKVLDILSCTASILSLCALGWERWWGITAPLARARRAKKARLFAALVWPVALAVALPTIFIPSPKDEQNLEEKACPDNTNVGYVFYSATLSFYLPATVMIILYARILSSLSIPPSIRAHQGRVPCPETEQKLKHAKSGLTRCATTEPVCLAVGHQPNGIALSPKGCELNQHERPKHNCKTSTPYKHPGETCCIQSRQRRATYTIVRLMALFLMCWSPFFIMLPIDSLCECVPDYLWQWSTWLGFTNSALNPVVYAAASPSVRRALHLSILTSSRGDVPMTPVRHL